MASMIAAAAPYARAGFEMIVDFSIPPWFLDTAKTIASKGEGCSRGIRNNKTIIANLHDTGCRKEVLLKIIQHTENCMQASGTMNNILCESL
jgi:hypothetical protein